MPTLREDPADADILARLPLGVARVIVHNKIDLCDMLPRRAPKDDSSQAREVWLSAKTGAGVGLLEQEVLELAGVHEDLESAFLARTRHLEALAEASLHLDAAMTQLSADFPALELFAEELREAHEALGAIVGVTTADDLLGAIFSRFCIGK